MAPRGRPSNLLKGLSRRTARCIIIVTPLIIISPALLVLAGVEWRWIAWYAFCCYVSFFEMVLMSAGMPCTFSSHRDMFQLKALNDFKAEVVPVVWVVIVDGLFPMFALALSIVGVYKYQDPTIGQLGALALLGFVLHCVMSTLCVLQPFMFSPIANQVGQLTGDHTKPIRFRLRCICTLVYQILFLPLFLYGYNETGRLNVNDNLPNLFLLFCYCRLATKNGDGCVFLPAVIGRWTGAPFLSWCITTYMNMGSLAALHCKHCGAVKNRNEMVRCKHCGACYCNDVCAKKDRPNHVCYQTGLRGNRGKTKNKSREKT